MDLTSLKCKKNKFILDQNHDCIDIDLDELAEAPKITNDASNKDSNNGLITSIWGPPTWESIHSITFGYPISPTDEQKKDYLDYFVLLGKVLPCIFCRNSYQQFINSGDTILDMNVMKSREELTKWAFRLHNAVNKKLGVDYGETYEEMCYKYESYRAKCTKTDKGCLMPLNIKAKSYQKAEIQRAPVIDKKYSLALTDHAEKLGMKNYKNLVDYAMGLKRNSKEWIARDCAARKIIKYMRKNGISALDNDGMPSYHEMMLISLLSSTLEKCKLDEYLKN